MKKIAVSLALLLSVSLSAFSQAKPSVTIFGDSYSTFEGYLTPDTMETWYFLNRNEPQRTDVKSVRQTWWWQVIKQMGWKLEMNNSWSGATICNTGYNDADYTHRSFMTRHSSLGRPDVILLFGGTNDSWCGAPLGEFKYEGWKRADLYCFRPALAWLHEHLQDRYPTADVFFMLNRRDLRPLWCARDQAEWHRQDLRSPQCEGHAADSRPGGGQPEEIL